MQKELFQESGSVCAICDNTDVNKLIIHHIEPFAVTKSHEPENLIVVCANCHRDADLGIIPKERLRKIKASLRGPLKFPTAKTGPSTIVSGEHNIVAATGGVVNIDSVQFRTAAKRSIPPVLPGTVATDALRYNYLNYLANRYMEFRKWHCDTEGTEFKPMLVHVNFKRRFKCAIRHLPLTRFDEAVDYLQNQIANSKLGKIQRGKSRAIFQSFEDFAAENK